MAWFPQRLDNAPERSHAAFVGTRTAMLVVSVCVFKLLYWAILSSALMLWGTSDNGTTICWPHVWPPVFKSHFTAYDGCYYLDISEGGYRAARPECAFYPLWPMLIRLCTKITGADSLTIGLALANGISIGAWLVYYRFVKMQWGDRIAVWALVWMVAYPGSLFYQFIYSESLFLLLVVGLCWTLRREYYGSAWVIAFLLPLTRPIGVMCVIPIVWDVAARSRKCYVPDEGKMAGVHLGWLVALGPVAGWLSYLCLMYLWTGNPFEGFSAQRFWGVHSVSNLWNIPKFVIGWFSPSQWHEFSGSLLDRAVFVLMLGCMRVLWRIDKGLLVWVLVLGVVPAMSGTFTSFTRFASVVFPIFIALAVWLERPEWRWMRHGLLGLFCILHISLVWRYVNFHWAG